MCIIQYYWLISLYLFIPLVRNGSSLIIKNSCVREELSNLPFFPQTQLQKITVEGHIFGEFALPHFTFGSCTSATDTLFFAYHLCGIIFPTLDIWK